MLINKFHDKGLVHDDVKWRNIGFYAKHGLDIPVLYDLHSVREYKQDQDIEWIEKAMKYLYPQQYCPT